MVQSNAILFGWNTVVVGRESIAGELFAHTVNFFEKLKTTNLLESYETVFVNAHGGDLNGFFLLKGTMNLWVAYNFSTDTWVNFKLFGGMGLMLAFVIAQALWISRYLPDERAKPAPAKNEGS